MVSNRKVYCPTCRICPNIPCPECPSCESCPCKRRTEDPDIELAVPLQIRPPGFHGSCQLNAVLSSDKTEPIEQDNVWQWWNGEVWDLFTTEVSEFLEQQRLIQNTYFDLGQAFDKMQYFIDLNHMTQEPKNKGKIIYIRRTVSTPEVLASGRV